MFLSTKILSLHKDSVALIMNKYVGKFYRSIEQGIDNGFYPPKKENTLEDLELLQNFTQQI